VKEDREGDRQRHLPVPARAPVRKQHVYVHIADDSGQLANNSPAVTVSVR